MSRFTNLTLVLSLAACEQATPAQNPAVFPEATTAPAPTPKPEPAPAPVVEATPTPTPRPAVAPVKPKIVRKPVRAPAAVKLDEPAPPLWLGKPGCRPGSRVACRWRPEEDERQVPRVTQKQAPSTDAAEQP